MNAQNYFGAKHLTRREIQNTSTVPRMNFLEVDSYVVQRRVPFSVLSIVNFFMLGATLMAAGTSSPELFAALFSVFLDPDNDTGPATILGSVVFNIGAIIGLSVWLSGSSRVKLGRSVRERIIQPMCAKNREILSRLNHLESFGCNRALLDFGRVFN